MTYDKEVRKDDFKVLVPTDTIVSPNKTIISLVREKNKTKHLVGTGTNSSIHIKLSG